MPGYSKNPFPFQHHGHCKQPDTSQLIYANNSTVNSGQTRPPYRLGYHRLNRLLMIIAFHQSHIVLPLDAMPQPRDTHLTNLLEMVAPAPSYNQAQKLVAPRHPPFAAELASHSERFRQQKRPREQKQQPAKPGHHIVVAQIQSLAPPQFHASVLSVH